jgi:hypothetical protein
MCRSLLFFMEKLCRQIPNLYIFDDEALGWDFRRERHCATSTKQQGSSLTAEPHRATPQL